MCDPLTLGLMGASAVASVAGSSIKRNDSINAANRDAAARNAVLKDTIAREQGFAGKNATTLQGNVANYAPGSQPTQLADAQGSRTNATVGNMTQDTGSDVPFTSDAPPAVKSELAKRMLAVHDAAVDRATKSAKVGGYGDTWLKNNLATNEADRNIGVTNNFANGEKGILSAQQDAASASAYKPPSVWGDVLGGASSIAAGAAGASGRGTAAPALNSGVWGAANPGVSGSAFFGPVG